MKTQGFKFYTPKDGQPVQFIRAVGKYSCLLQYSNTRWQTRTLFREAIAGKMTPAKETAFLDFVRQHAANHGIVVEDHPQIAAVYNGYRDLHVSKIARDGKFDVTYLEPGQGITIITSRSTFEDALEAAKTLINQLSKTFVL